MRLWVDIENEPQVQYLLPLVEAWRKLGMDAIVTARDYGATFALLESRGQHYHPIGASYGPTKRGKILGVFGRSFRLASLLAKEGAPDRLVSASRAGVLAARRLGVSSYVISDYEYANLSFFRWARATILFPDVIAREIYRQAGFPDERLIAFAGLKEDLTFAGVELDAIEPASFEPNSASSLVRVLVRPPAEESHYYASDSRSLYLEALRHVARDTRSVVVLAPRYARQVDDLKEIQPSNAPIVITDPVPFISLLKAVDLVLCSGGTMLREAAYLGIPAYGIFKSRVGGVDRYLERIGRATLITRADDLDRLELEKASGLSPLVGNPSLVEELIDTLLQRPGDLMAQRNPNPSS
jgi:predicted glycosyltransferase